MQPEEHIMNPDFTIDAFAAAMNMSKTVLHRKFRLLVGQTPNQFIRLVRLRKSVHLLQTTDHSISEVAYLTGFSQSHYYIKCFREVYNDTPKSLSKKYQTENQNLKVWKTLNQFAYFGYFLSPTIP
jgi:transcriptional regulator GlxA family with amidase domain